MRIDRWLEILVPICCVGGVTCLAVDAAEVARGLRTMSGPALTGGALLLVGATAGLLNYVVTRRTSRELAREANAAIAVAGKSRFVDVPDSALRPLVVAMNDCFAASDRAVGDANAAVKELEIQLKVATGQRRQAEAIIHSINDAVLVTDAFDEVLLANEAAAKSLGLDLADIGRKPIDDVLSDAALVNLIRDVRQSESRNERRVVEHRVRRDGKDSVFKLTLSAISQGGEGRGGGVVAVLHDMTRENEIARMKNEFVSSVSHELRTPLSSIRAYVEMLVDGEAQDEKTTRDFYDIILSEANRLGRLIDNILNISRIESGLVEIKKQPLSVMVVVKEAIDVIVPQAKIKNIRVEEHLEPSFYQTMADKDMLYQAVLNLLSNAVKYTPDGGSVTVRTSVDEARGRVAVRVFDTGVGIPPKDLPFVFDKFFRVEANKGVAKGTGLGLSLVKNMIETVHKGKMIAESEVGRGSCFGFELDLC